MTGTSQTSEQITEGNKNFPQGPLYPAATASSS